jgi:hypothetical protein
MVAASPPCRSRSRIALKTGEVTHANFAVRWMTESITVGAIAVDPMMNNDGSMSMTFTKDFMDKLPF